MVYKGALDGKDAHSTWVGNALIAPTAPGTDSYELNRNLVLTPGAIADSEPNLEIENSNVIGTGRASSVGRFDDEECSICSREVSRNEDRKLVVRRYFGELVEEDRRAIHRRTPDERNRPPPRPRRKRRHESRIGG